MFDFVESFFDSDDESTNEVVDLAENKRKLLAQPCAPYTPKVFGDEWFFEPSLNSHPSNLIEILNSQFDRLYMKKEYDKIILLFEDNKQHLVMSENTSVRKEIYHTYVHALVHSTTPSNVDQILSQLDNFCTACCFGNEAWRKSTTVKSSASFQLFVWEQTSRILVNGQKDLTRAIHLLQKCIHCRKSLPLTSVEYVLSKKEASGPNFIDTLYLGKARSFTLWTQLAKCYELISLPIAQKIAEKHAQAVQKGDIQEQQQQQKKERTTIVLNAEDLLSKFTDEAMQQFDEEFVGIYLNTEDNVHQIMHSQRNLVK